MRRNLLLLLAAILLLAGCGGTMEPVSLDSLLTQWKEQGYPDDIGGIYYSAEEGHEVIFLTSMKPKRIKELQGSISSAVIFEQCTYSHNQLVAVQWDVSKDMGAQGAAIYTAGIGYGTTDGQIHGFGESGREFRVVVGVAPEHYDRYVQEYQSRYGDMVHVECSEPVVLD